MLSNPPPSGLQARHQQHRRQNSTPTAFEAMKIAHNLPNMHPHQQQPQPQPQPSPTNPGRPRVSHRRGMSLDTRRQQMHSPTFRQDFQFPMVSEHTNNTGLTNTPQHVLRETQQQRIARPGSNQQAYANLAADENYLVSPHGTPQDQGFDGQCLDASGLPGPRNMNIPFDMYNGPVPLNMLMKKNQESFSENMAASQDFELFSSSTMSTPTFMNAHESSSDAPGWISDGEPPSTRRNSRRISNGIVDRLIKFENFGTDGQQRPITPPHQNANNYFPLTPIDTPHDRTIKHKGPQRFAEGYDESMEETLKPNRHTPSRRPKTTFDEMRRAAESQPMMPAPTRASTMPMPVAYDAPPSSQSEFFDMNQVNAGMTIQTQFDHLQDHQNPFSGTPDLSQHTTPVTPSMRDFSGVFDQKPDLQPPSMSQEFSTDGSPSTSTERPSHRGTHRRTESVASIASIQSAASIASIDIEQTKMTTGVTMDDIHQYIEGPDPRDNKWICTFEDCQKRFGRKENIKSHVQTHLNDRQYKCPTCHKCFVRQHDLKRHAKIHTGIKPYPCECGNSFARHDALTRHKQRGMCIGAFDGIVRKVVKRGRPRKHRPDLDERKDKSTRTRHKNMSVSSTSSQSGYSDSSAVNSPENPDHENDFDMLDDIMDVSLGGTTMNPTSLQGIGSSSAPMASLGADLAASHHSPSATSVHSYVSQMSHMSLHHPERIVETHLPSHPTSPAKSVASQYNEPPELSQSSSPPSCPRYYGTEPSSSAGDIMSSSASQSTSIIPSLAQGLEDNDDNEEEDILLQFTHSGDPNMLMLTADSKFDEAFDSTVGMFSNNDDLFFGSG
ncbi:uncharacterized protein BCR38DRAFT_47759 [Pseudomassariella vexata]|uniref:C2H2-type domain-containing protein n=1 Tax=Pseudomassariella vexata TaxID=1141098 RepID=A0A1Y2DNH4_9PEZI|nr:uncharacterized protein BCR38DRAFT_47759 [Pseudomassariella vexata]ORY60843.1 hypothetical protein BCR38DRAFT_47759 [Pseudomassariella vexata]